MKNFDVWNRYLDNQNHPLHGCVQFMVRDGNTPAPIFDSDERPLQNPQITDNYGRTQHQVFINSDVVAYFYKYIGNGNWQTQPDPDAPPSDPVIDTSDATKWSLQFTVESWDSSSIDLHSSSLFVVESMAELRALDLEDVPQLESKKKMILLLGYNQAGDKEPVCYIWNPDSTDIDDGGSIIQGSELTGRWILVQPTEHCDSRHFGVFPQDTLNGADQSTGILNLFNYCNRTGLKPFFNGSAEAKYFKFSNLVGIVSAIDVSPQTTFLVSGQSSITGEWNGDPKFIFSDEMTTVTVNCSKAKTSWGASQYIGVREVIIDQDPVQRVWTDCHIDMRLNPAYGFQFYHCSFEFNGNLGSDNAHNIHNSFFNCKMNERMLIIDGDFKANLTGHCYNCQIDPDDFYHSMDLFKQARCTSEPSPFFNYRDFPNVGKPYSNYTGNTVQASGGVWVTDLKNALATRVELEALPGQTALILEGVTGWYSVPAQITQLVIRESSVALEINGQTGIVSYNSDIEIKSMPSGANEGTATIQAFNSRISGITSEWQYFYAQSCTLNSVILAKNTFLKDSVINQNYVLIYQDGVSRTVTYPSENHLSPEITVTVSKFIHGHIENNTFNAQLVIDAQYKNTANGEHSTWPVCLDYVLVDSLFIKGNTSSIAEYPWYIWPCNGPWKFDNLHNYIFTDNGGTFESKTVVASTVRRGSNYTPGTPGTLYLAANSGQGDLGAWANTSEYIEQVMQWKEYMDMGDKYFCQMRFFSIGTRGVKFNIRISAVGSQTLNWPGKTQSEGHALITDDAYGKAYFGYWDWTKDDKICDVRNLYQLNATAYDPIFSPTGTDQWSPIFQIRNFIIGKADMENGSTINIEIEQI